MPCSYDSVSCSSPTFHKEEVAAYVPEPLRPALEPLLEAIASMTAHIRE